MISKTGADDQSGWPGGSVRAFYDGSPESADAVKEAFATARRNGAVLEVDGFVPTSMVWLQALGAGFSNLPVPTLADMEDDLAADLSRMVRELPQGGSIRWRIVKRGLLGRRLGFRRSLSPRARTATETRPVD
jgi:hypothetical protein